MVDPQARRLAAQHQQRSSSSTAPYNGHDWLTLFCCCCRTRGPIAVIASVGVAILVAILHLGDYEADSADRSSVAVRTASSSRKLLPSVPLGMRLGKACIRLASEVMF